MTTKSKCHPRALRTWTIWRCWGKKNPNRWRAFFRKIWRSTRSWRGKRRRSRLMRRRSCPNSTTSWTKIIWTTSTTETNPKKSSSPSATTTFISRVALTRPIWMPKRQKSTPRPNPSTKQSSNTGHISMCMSIIRQHFLTKTTKRFTMWISSQWRTAKSQIAKAAWRRLIRRILWIRRGLGISTYPTNRRKKWIDITTTTPTSFKSATRSWAIRLVRRGCRNWIIRGP